MHVREELHSHNRAAIRGCSLDGIQHEERRMKSEAELRAKLTVYCEQLEQVEQLLEIDATNEQFLALKSDLEKVISLTETLLAQVSAQEPLFTHLRSIILLIIKKTLEVIVQDMQTITQIRRN